MLRKHRLTVKQAIKLIEQEAIAVKQVVKTPFERAVEEANEYAGIGISLFFCIVALEEEEGFSHDAAVYGANNCSLDWRNEAVISAQEAKDNYPYASMDEIRQFMTQVLRFTGAEAAYACRKVFC